MYVCHCHNHYHIHIYFQNLNPHEDERISKTRNGVYWKHDETFNPKTQATEAWTLIPNIYKLIESKSLFSSRLLQFFIEEQSHSRLCLFRC